MMSLRCRAIERPFRIGPSTLSRTSQTAANVPTAPWQMPMSSSYIAERRHSRALETVGAARRGEPGQALDVYVADVVQLCPGRPGSHRPVPSAESCKGRPLGGRGGTPIGDLETGRPGRACGCPARLRLPLGLAGEEDELGRVDE